MATVTAKMVKELRDKTGVGMMDCKKALVAADGDMEAAVENLRKAGIAKAAKRAGRAAKEGRVVVLIEGGVAAVAETLCETDFVAKNEQFRGFGDELVKRIVHEYTGDGDVSADAGEAEKGRLADLVAVIGENLQVRRAVRWESDGLFASYLHMGGKIGVLVEAGGGDDEELLHDVCMHIAAFRPRFISPDDVPEDVVAKEKEIAAAQVEGKPEHIIDKIVMGKLNKWYTETCLTRQPWIRDDKSSLAKMAPKLEIRRFLRWEIGEEL